MSARGLSLLAGVLLLAGCSYIDSYTTRDDGLPRDVSSFIDRRSACGDARSEDPFDDDREDFMADQSALYCAGTDRELTRLREKYKDRSDVLAALNHLEAQLESR